MTTILNKFGVLKKYEWNEMLYNAKHEDYNNTNKKEFIYKTSYNLLFIFILFITLILNNSMLLLKLNCYP